MRRVFRLGATGEGVKVNGVELVGGSASYDCCNCGFRNYIKESFETGDRFQCRSCKTPQQVDEVGWLAVLTMKKLELWTCSECSVEFITDKPGYSASDKMVCRPCLIEVFRKADAMEKQEISE